MALTATRKPHVRILVVDDDENILDLYEKILRPHPATRGPDAKKQHPAGANGGEDREIDVCLCHNPPEAIRTVKESRPDPFSLAFLDVHLGAHVDNGIRLAEKIRQMDQDIEIVFVTGDAALDLSQIAADIPPKDKLFYLNKPFKPLEIRQFTESLSTKWLTERQLKTMRINLEHLVRERTKELSETNARLISEIMEKEKAKEQKRHSDDNHRKLIEHNSDSILVVDAMGKIRFVNPAGETLFGTTRDLLLGRDFQFSLEPGEHKEITLPHATDAETVCDMDIIETEWAGEKAFLAVLRDITDRKHLEENLLRSLDHTQSVIKGTIQLIARFLEMKDPYTAGHQKRVSELAFRIAESMGLNEHEREGILMAALIHDIGKISIPSEILSKPGRLSDIEYELIKTHSQKGYDILKEIEFPWPIARIVLQHHERLDGSGYPSGARGDHILFTSRILTVADVMEAISSHRPYRAALGVGKGVEHLQQFSGIYYDPEVVRQCVHLFQEENFEFKIPGLQTRNYGGQRAAIQNSDDYKY